MKLPKNSCRKGALPKSTDPMTKRLAVYSATAGAALLAAPVADAAIQNITGLSISLNLPQNGGNQSLSFDAGPFHGSMRGFNRTHTKWTYVSGSSSSIGPSSTFFTSSGFSTTVTYRYGQAGLHGKIAGSSLASRPAKGITFPSLKFSNGSHMLASRSYYGGQRGNFKGRSGYIAFSSNSYYGWLKIKVDLDAGGVANQISLVDNGNGVFGAFDNISNVAADGFTVGAVAAPEPSTIAISGLGLLAFGAAGVREMRRRKQRQKV